MNTKAYLGLAIVQELKILNEIKKITPTPDMTIRSKDKKVQRFLYLSEKKLKKGKISEFERNEEVQLLKDPKVKAYLEAANKVGQRIGWIKGGLFGGVSGGLTTAVMAGAAGASGLGLAALAILGAIAGGVSTGYPASKIYGILRRWKAEENMTKGGLDSGQIIRM